MYFVLDYLIPLTLWEKRYEWKVFYFVTSHQTSQKHNVKRKYNVLAKNPPKLSNGPFFTPLEIKCNNSVKMIYYLSDFHEYDVLGPLSYQLSTIFVEVMLSRLSLYRKKGGKSKAVVPFCTIISMQFFTASDTLYD